MHVGGTSYPTRELRTLSLARVAAYLSRDAGAQLFRNLVLSPTVLDAAVPQAAADRAAWPDLPPLSPAARQPPTWPDDQVRLAFGDVPPHLFDGDASATEAEDDEDRFWGMLYFNPEARDGDEASVGVMTVWLSSEFELSKAGCGRPAIATSVFQGLSPAFDTQMFAGAASASHDVAGVTLDQLAAGPDAKLARLARDTKRAIHWLLLDLAPPLFRRRGGGTLHLHGVSGLVEREAVALWPLRAAYRSCCVLFHRAATTQDLDTYTVARTSGSLHGLCADCLRPADLPAVQAENHIGFPLSYLQAAARISACLRAGDHAVAWVGTHGALTLASLHVAAAHRRTSGSAHVGQDLVALYAARNWAALALVLASLGIAVPAPGARPEPGPTRAGAAGHPSPASLIASTESSNPAGLRFFARLGWDAEPGARCWSAVDYPDESV